MTALSSWLDQEHSKAQTVYIVDKICQQPELVEELVNYIIGEQPLLQQRASWVLPYLPKGLIEPHECTLVHNLQRKNLHDAVLRNTLKLFETRTEIDEEVEEVLTEVCFRYLEEARYPIAVKVFAMSILEILVKKYPELKNELVLLIENQMPYASAGFQSRGKKILLRLKR